MNKQEKDYKKVYTEVEGLIIDLEAERQLRLSESETPGSEYNKGLQTGVASCIASTVLSLKTILGINYPAIETQDGDGGPGSNPPTPPPPPPPLP